MVRTLRLHSETHPELSRILAMAAAIAVHAFAFLLLLVPMAGSRLDAPAPAPEQPRWQKPVELTPPPRPPEIVPIRPQSPRPQVQPRSVPRIDAPTIDQAIVEHGHAAADPVVEQPATDAGAGPSIGAPLPGMRLEYAFAPAPPYPGIAARRGIEGSVLLKILVGTDGKPLDVVISRSSGHKVLDDAARRFVLENWRFKPAMHEGRAVQAHGLVPIEFKMR